MDTLELHIQIEPREPWSEILLAQLAELGFDAFEEDATGLKAYGPAQQIQMKEVLDATLLGQKQQEEHGNIYQITFEKHLIPYQNWNEAWEADFHPVAVGEELLIVAPFHKRSKEQSLVIEIQPRTSFGTGHHQTTWLMAKAMLDLQPMLKSVLDMGTGTGVLAILAEKRGAECILAIDNEDWSVENTKENIERNSCTKIKAICGEEKLLEGEKFDLILANINKNVLKKQIPHYSRTQVGGGSLFLSGFFESDAEEMIAYTEEQGYVHQEVLTKETWAMLRFQKK